VSVADLLADLLGPDLPISVRAYDGSACGDPSAPTTLIVRSPDALRRVITAPNELGFGRAYVADLDVDGDISTRSTSPAWSRCASGPGTSPRRQLVGVAG
jgi:cyclopropane-fatty-acyl-phospholipid synthase